VASGRDTKSVRALPVNRVGIRDTQREMKLAVSVLGTDRVVAFRRLVVALLSLGSNGHSPQCHLVGSQNMIVMHEGHGVPGFHNHDPVSERYWFGFVSRRFQAAG